MSYLIVEDGIGHCADGEADDEGDQHQHEGKAEDFGHFFFLRHATFIGNNWFHRWHRKMSVWHR